MSTRFVLIPLASQLTGYTVKAIEKKIERGQWRLGVEFVKAPDGHRLIDMQAYERWVLGDAPRHGRTTRGVT